MKMNRAQREAFYREIVQQRTLNNSLPLEQFCKEHGISVWTFHQWRKRLLSASGSTSVIPSSERSFIPLRIQLPPSDNRAEVLFPNGVIVRFAAGIGKETLADIATLRMA